MTLKNYLDLHGVNDFTDQETVRKLTRQYELSNANIKNIS